MGSLTVIIPTYNREVVLGKALEGYLVQSNPAEIEELLVVDDGSTDGTENLVAEIGRRSPFPIRYLRQSNKGPAAARNYGIREARSPIILFTDSDIVPTTNFVAQHADWHRANPELNIAILGYVTWPEEPRPTAFMRWYGEEAIFKYKEFQNEVEISSDFFYTCNISLKTKFLKNAGLFDEDFRSAAYEDIELGYRLSKANVRLLYNRHAIAYHHQFFLFSDACRKAKANQAAEKVFLSKEAGRVLMAARLQRRSRIWFPIAHSIATIAALCLWPATWLINSSVPLPGIVYRLFFWYHVTRRFDSLSS
jgi:glycosyltransferase involved in cell wall biosynthesis